MSETVAMSFSGHRDRGVFNRYNCVSKVDQVDAREKVAAYQNGLARVQARSAASSGTPARNPTR